MTAFIPADFDICECGDYRHQHRGVDGVMGRCRLCPRGEFCLVFRLYQQVTWERI